MSGHPAWRMWCRPVAALLATTILSAASAAAAGSVAVGLESELRGFDTVQGGSLDPAGEITMRAIQEPLLKYDYETGEFRPLLATEWSVSDDQTVWTFTLRPGVKFHDGSDFTATDVAHHFNRTLDPAQKAAARSTLSAISKVVEIDPHVVEFHLKHPWPALPLMLASTGMSGPIPSHKAVDAGTQNRNPIGTGPFRMARWSSGDRIVAERFEDYWASDEITLDQVVFRFLPDTQTRYASLKSGDIDVLWTDRGQTIHDALKDPGLKPHIIDGAGAETIILNARKAPLSDKRVRAAVAHAWNQAALVQVSWQNTRPVVSHPLGTNVDCGPDNYRAYDPAKAKELLAEVGAVAPLNFVHTATSRGRELGELMQQMLRQVGVQVVLEPVDQSTLMRRYYTHDYDIIGWRFPDSADMAPQLFSAIHSGSTTNLSGVSNPELDALAEKMRLASTREDSLKLQCEVVAGMNEEVAVMYRGGGRYHVFTNPRVTEMPKPWRGIVDVTRIRVAD
ncbi:ABC transporter substrate-binding protein [Falsigemmobacter faecalis]|uniref:Solute-binding protein family 5 domain-containing protein n=1 Tax=Falsigemmobacter faecalis TaxID=2488730 RepID=A0A3P3DDL8_9RHOB|nr:ABC transporter substrate-binding protein [Falsigemmobacter faecalis]RRH72383.1 hypothetical protein EG244_14835 [Falsigemmobacter faecalis]